MMRFRTEIEIRKSDFSISHDRIGFLAGSCFSQHIAQRLERNKFNIVANPSGILFNPESIATMLRRLSSRTLCTREELFRADGLWHCYAMHGSFSGVSEQETLERINRSLMRGADQLRDAHYVILTLGTARVYRLAASGEVVANCHKQPASLFRQEMLSVEAIVRQFVPLLEGPLAGKQILFTISPVRHLKDGLQENFRSKATLRCAVDALQGAFSNVYYFPSFEILNDDLRDYRFYADDMLHPSAQAVEYVWEKFAGFAMEEPTRALLPKLERLDTALQHRVLHPSDERLEAFRQSSLRLIGELQAALPGVDFERETRHFEELR